MNPIVMMMQTSSTPTTGANAISRICSNCGSVEGGGKEGEGEKEGREGGGEREGGRAEGGGGGGMKEGGERMHTSQHKTTLHC